MDGSEVEVEVDGPRRRAPARAVLRQLSVAAGAAALLTVVVVVLSRPRSDAAQTPGDGQRAARDADRLASDPAVLPVTVRAGV